MSTLPFADDPDAWERALLQRQIQGLERLAEMGLAIAAVAERAATAPGIEPESAQVRAANIDFARVSRAVRLTYALQSRLVADSKGRPRAAANDDRDDGIEDDDPFADWERGPRGNHRRRLSRRPGRDRAGRPHGARGRKPGA